MEFEYEQFDPKICEIQDLLRKKILTLVAPRMTSAPPSF